MIDPKQLNETHKGAKVVYINRSQDGRLLVREWGHISSWNERGVFVRFPDNQSSQLCRPETLFDYDEYEMFYDKSEKADMKDTWGWDITTFMGQKKLKVSPGHKFYTQRGWVRADDLNEDDSIFFDELQDI